MKKITFLLAAEVETIDCAMTVCAAIPVRNSESNVRNFIRLDFLFN